jgi:hypothetical protein
MKQYLIHWQDDHDVELVSYHSSPIGGSPCGCQSNRPLVTQTNVGGG